MCGCLRVALLVCLFVFIVSLARLLGMLFVSLVVCLFAYLFVRSFVDLFDGVIA